MAKITAIKERLEAHVFTGAAGLEHGIKTTLNSDIGIADSDQFKLGIGIAITYTGDLATGLVASTGGNKIWGFIMSQQISPQQNEFYADYPQINGDIDEQVVLADYQLIEVSATAAVGTAVYLDDDGELNDTAGTNSRQIGIYVKGGNAYLSSDKTESKLVMLDPRKFDV